MILEDRSSHLADKERLELTNQNRHGSQLAVQNLAKPDRQKVGNPQKLRLTLSRLTAHGFVCFDNTASSVPALRGRNSHCL